MKKRLKKVIFIIFLICNYLVADSLQIHLQKGWNLVGTPQKIDNPQNLLKNIEAIFTYDTKSNKWRVLIKDKNISNFLSIKTINAGEGFWCLSKKDQILQFDTVDLKNNYFDFQNGWQILSPLEKKGLELEKLTDSKIKIIWTYKDNQWFFYTKDKSILKKVTQFGFKQIKKILYTQGFWLLYSKDFEIPNNLSDDEIFRFLLKTTFGPTKELIQEVKQKGVKRWLDEQLNQSYEQNDSMMYQILRFTKYINSFAYKYPIEEYLKEDTIHILPPKGSDQVKLKNYFLSSWTRDAFWGKKQLRSRVAYALSQIVVASNSSGIFSGQYHALAAYYDIMLKHAFGNFGDLLKDVSKNPAMGYYLTFYGNQKKHLNKKGEWVYPDENYAREVMQLFSIGPFLLNEDATKKKDENSNFIASYTQKDVNELARVFTGLDFRLARGKFGNTGIRRGDMIHKMNCIQKYHDMQQKELLGKIIPAGGDCYEDIDRAMDILLSHSNSGPHIVKKLILRLVKSNPSASYIKRVVKVFNDNGKGVKGDLKATIRAIYTDKEFWDDILNKRVVKFKEPLIAFLNTLRAFGVKPLPKWHIKLNSPSSKEVRNKKVYIEDQDFVWIDDFAGYFGEGPTQSKTVFNFYSDDYIPNDEYFRKNTLVAPELQIQTDGELVAYHNYMFDVLSYEKNYVLNKHGLNLYRPYHFVVYKNLKEYGNALDMVYHKDKYYFDLSECYAGVLKALQEEIKKDNLEDLLDEAYKTKHRFKKETRIKAITAIVDFLDERLLGHTMSKGLREYLIKDYEHKIIYYFTKDLRTFYALLMRPLIHKVLISDDFKVE